MDFVIASSSIAKISPIASGFCASRGRHQNAVSATSSSSSRAQLAEKGSRTGVAVGTRAVSAVDVEAQSKNGWNDVRLSPRQNLVLASLISGLANVRSAALADDQVLERVNEAVTSGEVLDSGGSFDIPDFLLSNPLVLVGSGLALVLPLLITTIFKKNNIAATEAYEKLGDTEAPSQLLDIRAADDVKVEGSPSLKAYRKKPIQVPYSGESEDFVATVLSKIQQSQDTTVYILDSFDGNSSTVAKLLTKAGVKAAYPIKGGAEGPGGWQFSELPWQMPSKGFSFNLGEVLPSADSGSIVPATLGVAAAAGVGFVVLTEAETLLQLVGSAFLLQLFAKKLLFAKDRKKTAREIQAFLDTKVAPKELVEELKGISASFLPNVKEVQTATANGPSIIDNALTSAGAEASKTAEEAQIAAKDVTGTTPQAAIEETQKTAEAAVETAASAAGEKAEEVQTTTSVVGDAAETAAEKSEEVEEKVESASDTAKEAVIDKADEVENKGEEVVEKATNVASEKKEEVQTAAEETFSTAGDVAAEKKGEVQATAKEAADKVADVGAGTKGESQATAEEAVDKVANVGAGTKGEAQATAGEAVDKAADVAGEKKEEAQTTVEEVVDGAGDVAAEKKGELQATAEEAADKVADVGAGTKGEAQATAGEAVDKAADVAGEKKEEAQTTVEEVVDGAGDVAAEKKGELQATAEEAADKVADVGAGTKGEAQVTAGEAVDKAADIAGEKKEEAQTTAEEVVDGAGDVAAGKKGEAQATAEEAIDTTSDVAAEKKEEAQTTAEETVGTTADAAGEKKEEVQATAGETVGTAADVAAEKKEEAQTTAEEAVGATVNAVESKSSGVKAAASDISKSSTDLPRSSRPLSPYGQYPGLKPPTSPSPSRP